MQEVKGMKKIIAMAVAFMTVFSVSAHAEDASVKDQVKQYGKAQYQENVKFKQDKMKETKDFHKQQKEEFKGKEVELTIKDAGDGQTRAVQVQVRENPPEGEGSMGVAISNTELEKIV